mmetsp:Transcript_7698/g.34884  ORF Transcript_7698/g.34884 Transcript_7698/m.34884 type:complete len:305 (+) Transcript_7698:894-1808(+)
MRHVAEMHALEPEDDVPDERVPHENHDEDDEEVHQIGEGQRERVRDDAEPRLEVHQLQDASEDQDDVDPRERHVQLHVVNQVLHLQEHVAHLGELVRNLKLGHKRRRLDVFVDVVVNVGLERPGAAPAEDVPHHDRGEVDRDGRDVDVVPHRREVRHVAPFLLLRVDEIHSLLVHRVYRADSQQQLHGEASPILRRLVQLDAHGVDRVRHLDLTAVREFEVDHDVAKVSELGVVHHDLRGDLLRLDVVNHQPVNHHVQPAPRLFVAEVNVEEVREAAGVPGEVLVPESVRRALRVEELLAVPAD